MTVASCAGVPFVFASSFFPIVFVRPSGCCRPAPAVVLFCGWLGCFGMIAVDAAAGAGVSCVISTSALLISTAQPSSALLPASAMDSVSGKSSSSITMPRLLIGICCIVVTMVLAMCVLALCVSVVPISGFSGLGAATCQ